MSAPLTSAPAVLTEAAHTLGADPATAVLVRHHGTQVWHLPRAGAIVRVSGLRHHQAAERSVALTRWLHTRGVPVTEPLLDRVLITETSVATLWRYYPQPADTHPAPADLGVALTALHQAGPPPASIHLPAAAPLSSLRHTLNHTTTLATGVVTELSGRIDDLLDAYYELDFPLGVGLIHGDAWLGNILFDGDRPVLGDWDEAVLGPRVLDLANLWQGHRRFGRTRAEMDAFTAAYGYDLSSWPGLDVLIRIRDLHTLGSYVRAADRGDQAAQTQLTRRLATLDDPAASWTSR
ncbi:phosphotransferase [Nocardiopsis sp. NPDC006139]|uniref:phosphotransferase enzyme family protein n=1 Tax=Nocardiopsis sp. NPDC006139 TaxID=3154578 RepID=UPI0033A5A41A